MSKNRPLRRRLVRITKTEEVTLYLKTKRRNRSWISRRATKVGRWLYEWAARGWEGETWP